MTTVAGGLLRRWTIFRAQGRGPIRTDYPLGETPLLTLIKGIAARPDITGFHYFEKTLPD